MRETALRHKHFILNQEKLDKVRSVLDASSDTDAIDQAMDIVCAEAEIDAVMRKLAGKVKLRKVFR